jgi:hypothetical protein
LEEDFFGKDWKEFLIFAPFWRGLREFLRAEDFFFGHSKLQDFFRTQQREL